MRAARAILLPSFLLVATSALAAPGQPIPCDPPLDRPLRLIVTQHMWLADGSPATATVTRTLRFVRDAQGLAVEAQIAALETDQSGADGDAARTRMALAYGAPGEVRTRVRLDGLMAIRSVDSLDRLWQDFRGRQARLDTAMMAGGKPHARTEAMLRMLDAMGDAERIAILTGFLTPVLRHCGAMPPMEAARTVDGALTIDSRTDSGGMSDIGHHAVDVRTGLLRRLERTISTADAPLRPLRETWLLSPE